MNFCFFKRGALMVLGFFVPWLLFIAGADCNPQSYISTLEKCSKVFASGNRAGIWLCWEQITADPCWDNPNSHAQKKAAMLISQTAEDIEEEMPSLLLAFDNPEACEYLLNSLFLIKDHTLFFSRIIPLLRPLEPAKQREWVERVCKEQDTEKLGDCTAIDPHWLEKATLYAAYPVPKAKKEIWSILNRHPSESVVRCIISYYYKTGQKLKNKDLEKVLTVNKNKEFNHSETLAFCYILSEDQPRAAHLIDKNCPGFDVIRKSSEVEPLLSKWAETNFGTVLDY